jgi:hypothetical protein
MASKRRSKKSPSARAKARARERKLRAEIRRLKKEKQLGIKKAVRATIERERKKARVKKIRFAKQETKKAVRATIERERKKARAEKIRFAKQETKKAVRALREEMKGLVRDIAKDREAAFRAVQDLTSWQFAMYADELADMFDMDVGELYDYYYYGDAA